MKFNVGDRIVSKHNNETYEVKELPPTNLIVFPYPVYHLVNVKDGKVIYGKQDFVNEYYTLSN